MQTKEIRQEILRLSIPASLEVVFQLLLGVVDTIFVGQLGTYALAGVSLTNQIVALILFTFSTIGIGASILISQYYGKRDEKNISIISGQALIFGLFISLLITIVMIGFATNLLQVIGAEKQVIEQGVPFFMIVALSMPASLLGTVAGAILRSIGNTKTPMIITSISVVINTSLNYLLIFGFGVIPALGVIGSAYATLIARVIATMLMFYYLFFINKKIKFSIIHFFIFNRTKMFEMIKLICPLTLGAFIWVFGTFIYTLFFTRLGTNQLAASQIISNIENVFIMFSFGIGVSGLVLVAKEIGADNIKLMNKKANEILKIGLVFSGTCGLIMLATSYFIHTIYPDINADASHLAKWGLIFFALFQPIKVLNMIMGDGILQSGGLTKFVTTVDIGTIFIVGLPAAYILGIYLGLGFAGIIIGKILEEIFRLIVFMVRYKTPNWYRVLT